MRGADGLEELHDFQRGPQLQQAKVDDANVQQQADDHRDAVVAQRPEDRADLGEVGFAVLADGQGGDGFGDEREDANRRH